MAAKNHKYKNYTIILGAGASHGASFDNTPPLDKTFLESACTRFANKKGGGADVQAWRRFKTTLEDANLKLSDVMRNRLEELSTYLEAKSSMRSLQIGQGRPREYKAALEALTQVIGHTLIHKGGTKKCSLHQALFELVEPNAVVTFNYDLIADQTLHSMGKLNWTRRSYAWGENMHFGRSKRKIPRKRIKGSIPLFKMHGSINWQKLSSEDGFSLVTNEFDHDTILEIQTPPKNPLVVPPVAAKYELENPALQSIWREALDYMRESSGWIFWGYSFPMTDTITQVLCRTALQTQTMPKSVIVINPDAGACDRIKKSLTKVKTHPYSSIERFLFDHDSLPH